MLWVLRRPKICFLTQPGQAGFSEDLLWAWASLLAPRIKNPPATRMLQEMRVRSLDQEDPLRRTWQPTPIFLSGKSHEWRRLVGYSPWGCKESDTTEQLTLSLIRWPLDRSPSLLSPYPPAPHQPPWLPGSKIKQTFLSTNLASLLAFEG